MEVKLIELFARDLIMVNTDHGRCPATIDEYSTVCMYLYIYCLLPLYLLLQLQLQSNLCLFVSLNSSPLSTSTASTRRVSS